MNKKTSDVELRVLLDLCMVSDPWPSTVAGEAVLKSLLNREARARGFDGWVDAYHGHEPLTVTAGGKQ